MALHSRVRRINEELKAMIADVIANEVKDPRLHEVMVTVTSVNTTNDLSQAQVFVSVYGNEEQTTEVMEALKKSQPFIKREIAQRITFRYMPDLIFRLDETGKNAAHINNLLRSIERENPNAFKEPDPEEDPSDIADTPSKDAND